jgi:hypothetical protein
VTLPQRIPKKAKRASRWRSQAHCNFVRSHGCSVSGCTGRPIEVAHVRNGSGAGIGQKPDDFRCVSLCRDHHDEQHRVGEITFWEGWSIELLIREFNNASPKRHEIEAVMRERKLSWLTKPPCSSSADLAASSPPVPLPRRRLPLSPVAFGSRSPAPRATTSASLCTGSSSASQRPCSTSKRRA